MDDGLRLGDAGSAEMSATMQARREPDDKQWGVDHFAKKLLRLEGIFHTDAARTLARARTAFMRAYLDQLAGEIRGER